MNEFLTYTLIATGLGLLLVSYLWALFGTFRTNRAIGWLYFLVPMMGATAWLILDWNAAKKPVAMNIIGGLLCFGLM